MTETATATETGTGTEPPFYRLHLFACTNQRAEDHPRGSCGRKGSQILLNAMKQAAKEAGLKDLRIQHSGCLERCELGPVVVIYPQGIWYRLRSLEDAGRIVTEHVIGGRIVSDLQLVNADRLPEDLSTRGGPSGPVTLPHGAG